MNLQSPGASGARVAYSVQVFGSLRDSRVRSVRAEISDELARLGIAAAVEVRVSKSRSGDETPAIGLIFGSEAARMDRKLEADIGRANREGLVVLPVVDDLHRFHDHVPPAASARNGIEWSGSNPPLKVARVILQELGIEDTKRRVFISHRRSDALQVAEQLHDSLTHRYFDPFIDRFAIRPGAVVQEQVIEAIEEFAFLLLLESPEAHQSEWVLQEVDYALSHSMGLLIVSWPGAIRLPGTVGLPRLELSEAEVSAEGAREPYWLTGAATERVLDAVEQSHAQALSRRRRMLIQSVQDSVDLAGGTCIPLVHWRLDVEVAGARAIVAIAPRPPDARDLEALDAARIAADPSAQALLVHGARAMGAVRERHLDWVIGGRSIRLLPDSQVGGNW